jgi:hypothetical protein
MCEDLPLKDKDVFAALDSKFNTMPSALPVHIDAALPAVVTANNVDDDFDQARTTLRNLITKGEQALDGMIDVARQSDHPRAYEVTGQLIKTVADTAKDLLALQKARRDLRDPEEAKPQQIGTQNNIVFAGSTNELLKALRSKNENIIDATAPNTSKL